MEMDWNAEVVDQVESHWRHRLRPRLDGLSDDEYFWKPVPDSWTLSRRGTSTALSFGGGELTWDYGEPREVEPVTTIAWRLAHPTICLAETSATHFGGPPADMATFDTPGPRRTRYASSTRPTGPGSMVSAASAGEPLWE